MKLKTFKEFNEAVESNGRVTKAEADGINKLILNEATTDSAKALNLVESLDAEDMEQFLGSLSNYFLRESNVLTNMDAKGISKDLMAAYKKIKKRSGN